MTLHVDIALQQYLRIDQCHGIFKVAAQLGDPLRGGHAGQRHDLGLFPLPPSHDQLPVAQSQTDRDRIAQRRAGMP
jgi:hypothetical protein